MSKLNDLPWNVLNYNTTPQSPSRSLLRRALIHVDTTAGIVDYVVNLPAIAPGGGVPSLNGAEVIVKRASAVNAVDITPAGTDQIEDLGLGTEYPLNNDNDVVHLVADEANLCWHVC